MPALSTLGTSNRTYLQKHFAIPHAFTLPIDPSLSKSDELPVVLSHPESPVSDIFNSLAETVRAEAVCDL